MTRRGTGLLLALALALAALWALQPPSPCPCHRLNLPEELAGRPWRDTPETADLYRSLRPEALRLRSYEGVGAALLLHFHRPDGEHGLFAHAPEVCVQFHGWTIMESRNLSLAPGTQARVLRLAQGRMRRFVHYAYLDPATGRPRASALGAWLAGLARALGGQAAGGSLLILDSGDLPSDDEARREWQDRRFAEILSRISALLQPDHGGDWAMV